MKTRSFLSIRYQRPIYLFLGMCFNLLVLTPAVYAATQEIYTPSQVAWLVLLGVVTLALSIYLFVVMFQPERF
jgi:K+-transporting ATPase KdpF subunit